MVVPKVLRMRFWSSRTFPGQSQLFKTLKAVVLLPPSSSFVDSWRTRRSFTCRSRAVHRSYPKNRLPISLLKLTGLTVCSPGKNTFFMAKKFAFCKVFSDGTAVYREKRFLHFSAHRLCIALIAPPLPVPVPPVISVGYMFCRHVEDAHGVCTWPGQCRSSSRTSRFG